MSSEAPQLEELQAQVEQAQGSAEQKADEIKAQAARGKDEAATGWQSMKDNWQSHVADLHNKAAGKKAEIDRRKNRPAQSRSQGRGG